MGRSKPAPVALLGLALTWGVAAPGSEPPAEVERGRQVYAEQKCAACHSIAGVGSRRYPLDGVGSRLSENEVRRWIVSPREMKATVRKPSYDLPERDLDALVAYMLSLVEE
jgi:mono/diheme cytochrome c family protein